MRRYTSGVQAVREEPESGYVNQEVDSPGISYVLNTNTMKFHYPDCSSVDEIYEQNRWDVAMSRDEILRMGYVPCKRCDP